MRRGDYVPAAVALAGVAGAGGAIAAVLADESYSSRGVWALAVVYVGLGFIGAGLVARYRRPHSPIWLLMVAEGFCWFAATAATTATGVLFDAGVLGVNLCIAIAAHIVTSFPSGHLERARERALIAITYFLGLVMPLPALARLDPTSFDCGGCPRMTMLAVLDDGLVEATVLAQDTVALGTGTATVLILSGRWRNGSRPLRRALGPVLVAGAVLAAVFMAGIWGYPLGLPPRMTEAVFFAAWGVLGTLPYVFLAGLARSRLERGVVVGDLVARLGDGGSAAADDVRGALAHALGDPSLEIAYWLPGGHGYVDEFGSRVVPAAHAEGRAVTEIEHEGVRIAAVVHDASLTSEEPELVRDAGAAAALAIRNRRLAAELRARVEDLRASRARIVKAGDDARRQIERDLHDGAQQRLVAVALTLRLAQSALDGDEGLTARLEAAQAGLAAGLAELRELAHGIHPAVLTARGLAPAVRGLAGRSPIPVTIRALPEERLADDVEAAVYHVVAEGLGNAARHSGAGEVVVSVTEADGRIRVEVADDGAGGADPAAGTGLRGLEDRVGALDGRLAVSSPAGGGTTVTAEISC